MYKKTYQTAVTFALTLLLSSISFAQEKSQVKIKNFGQMDQKVFRGAQPKEKDYKDLAGLGVKTVVDLRHDPEPYARQACEQAGMKYVNIPMIAKKYPEQAHIEEFLRLAGDESTGTMYVHCAGGRHRTGVMGAVYRFNNYGWDYEKVYKEMKDYDFYTRWGHGAFKDFVEDYWSQKSSESKK